MHEYHQWNVTFLMDAVPPRSIVLLRRAATKEFAPNLYTGIGGKVEPGETVLQSAYRELAEESGITGLTLTEFIRCVRDGIDTLHYFWGTYPVGPLPASDDGTLEWVRTDDLFTKDLIPTTLLVCKQWAGRSFFVDAPFTVHIKTVGKKDTVALVQLERLEENLH